MRMADGLLCVISLERALPSLDTGVFEAGVYQPGVFV
jgi:hypothetical protein